MRLLFIRLSVLALMLTVYGLTRSPVSAFEFVQEPNHIIIPSLHLSLPVITSQLSYNTWEVSPVYASFGQFTALPGTAGNTVIFAHARPGLFINLPQLKVGDIIMVYTKLDSFSYRVEDTFTVKPEEVEVILSDEKYELTLFTCTGVGDVNRYVVKATLIPTLR